MSKEDAMTRTADPVVRHLSSAEAGDIRELAERIHAKSEYFVIKTGVLSVALIARYDLDDYLDWREERIREWEVEEATQIHRVSIEEVYDLSEIAMRICRNSECFVLEKDGVLPVAFIHPIDLDSYLDWRRELMEALDESEQDVREGRTRPAEALLAELKQDVGLVPDGSTTRRD
jgi:hypothetical protein